MSTEPNKTGSGNGAGAQVAQGGSKNKNKNKFYAPKVSKFEGRHDALKGHVYDLGKGQSDTFIKTSREITDYMGRTYEKSGDICESISNEFTMIDIADIEEPDDVGNLIALEQWKFNFKERELRVRRLHDQNKTLYAIVWSQCSDAMRDKVQSQPDFANISTERDGLRLLSTLRVIAFDYESTTFRILSINNARDAYYGFKQGANMSLQDYYEEFLNRYEVFIRTGGTDAADVGALEYIARRDAVDDVNDLNEDQVQEAKDWRQATVFISNADKHRYERMRESLHNDFLSGNNRYPKTLTDAYSLLSHWKDKSIGQRTGNSNDGVAFATTAESSGTGNGSGKNKGRYWRNKKGNESNNDSGNSGGEEVNKSTDGGSNNNNNSSSSYSTLSSSRSSSFCTNSSSTSSQTTGTTLYTWSFNMSGHNIPKTWILLDNQSTVDIFSNAELLSNIRSSEEEMTIHCNAGQVTTNLIGDLRGYGTVWYSSKGIANILSLSNVREKGHEVTYDGASNEFCVYNSNGKKTIFTQSDKGLYFHDTGINSDASNVALITTVEDNMAKFSQRDVARASEARKLMRILGRPSQQQFLEMLEKNQLPNCPVTRRDAVIAHHIFGPDVGSLKGKTVHRPGIPVSLNISSLPDETMEIYRTVTLCADIMFVNKLAFVVTISRDIHFSTVELIGNRAPSTVLHSLVTVMQLYKRRGFQIKHILMDGEFHNLVGPISDHGASLNTASRAEHVPEIERFIRTLKERTRCIYNTLPYETMPPRLLTEMIYASNFWLNAFPHPNGISNTMSPRAIITGQCIDYNRHCQLEFGTYVQTHEEHDNSMAARTCGALALRPTGNSQGGWYFFNLNTGRVINRHRWTELPLPSDVIVRVRNLARRAHVTKRGIVFQNGAGEPLFDDDNDDSDDSSYHPDLDGESIDADEGVDMAFEDNENVDENIEPEAAEDEHVDPIDPIDPIDDEGNYVGNENDQFNDIPDVAHMEAEAVNDHQLDELIAEPHDIGIGQLNDEDQGVGDDQGMDIEGNPEDAEAGEDPGVDDHLEENAENDNRNELRNNIETEMNNRYGNRSGNYNLRPRRMPDYSHLHTMIDDQEHVTLTQYSVNKGLKLFGKDGETAVLEELKQLHDRGVIRPVNAKDMSREEKQQALQYLMFLKKKRCGKIKGRGCADGRKQRLYMSKEETSSPTVSTEALMLSCVIDADEQRVVGTADIPGAFLHADMDDIVYLRMDGKMVELLVTIDKTLYEKHIEVFSGRPVIYLRLEKALYGTLKAALLFWEKLSSLLKSWGFHINPYDKCVANKEINGKQCTILWHVDDLKISHVEKQVVEEMIKKLSDEFGSEDAPLKANIGKTHDYLGMTLDYSIDGKVQFIMEDYINSILDEAPEDMKGTAPSPAANHLFQVNEVDPIFLGEHEAEYFHHTVAQLLFLCKRARPDIQTAVSFLCTRVKKPDCDDYKKLARVIKYLRSTVNIPLTLEASSTHIMQWWVDASYAVHPDMKSHTGGILSLGKGAVYATSTRQKINTKSSTEAELVGVNDVLPQALWTKYFLKEQGYGCDECIINQDNTSAMLLERNGRTSSSKRTRHIHIRYYFITDKIANGEIKIQYCNTSEMVADFFTKPLQGLQFTTFRDFIMNVPNSKNFYSMKSTVPHIVNDASTSTLVDEADRSVLEYDVKNVNPVLEESELESSNENDDDTYNYVEECGSSGLTDVKEFIPMDEKDSNATWTVVTKKNKKKQNKKQNELSSFY
jgi:hypothetical protein